MPRSTLEKAISKLAVGSPKAVFALASSHRVLGEERFSILVSHLNHLGFKGSEIHTCWNGYSRQDSYKFFDAICARNPEMLSLAGLTSERIQTVQVEHPGLNPEAAELLQERGD